MEVGLRDLLVGVGSLSLAKIGSPLSAAPGPEERPVPRDQGWHPLTRSQDRPIPRRARHSRDRGGPSGAPATGDKVAGNSDPCIRASEQIRSGQAGPDASHELLVRTSTFAEHGQRQS
jgi:hypothetical protein